MIAEVNHICKQDKKWDCTFRAVGYVGLRCHTHRLLRGSVLDTDVTQFSTIAHNANLVAFICVYILRVLALMYTPDADSVVIDGDTYYNYRAAAGFRNSATHLQVGGARHTAALPTLISPYDGLPSQALNAFLSVFKLVRFFSYIPRFALVTNTLYLSAAGVTGFGLIFAVVFCT